jgi:hypothetical protein
MGGSYTGQSLPRPPSSDSNEDREIDFDDHRDPLPVKGPSPPGISLQDAIEVKQWHNIHIRHHQTIILHIYRYMISYIDIVQNIVHYIGAIIFDIVYDNGYDIVYDIFDVSI